MTKRRLLGGEQIPYAKIPCPYCARKNDSHICVEGETPDDGDYSICWDCRKVAIFACGPLGTTLRKLTPDEETKALADPKVRQGLAAVRESYTPLQAIDLLRGLRTGGS